MKNINLSKISADPVLISAYLTANIRDFLVAKNKEVLIDGIKSVSLKRAVLRVEMMSPLQSHELWFYQGELEQHMKDALSRIGNPTAFRLVIR